MRIIVGLGNPGEEYEETRHNVGFSFLDFLVSYLINEQKQKKQQWKLEKKIGGEVIFFSDFCFFKPKTGMNVSGTPLKLFLNHFNLSMKDVLVIYDDFSLPLGAFRFRNKGRSAGHNGIANILKENQNILRLKIGIGFPPKNQSYSSWVLEKFFFHEKEKMKQVFLLLAPELINWTNGKINVSQLTNLLNRKSLWLN